jgi:uncharacterized repeat protein (TIGR03803 family)
MKKSLKHFLVILVLLAGIPFAGAQPTLTPLWTFTGGHGGSLPQGGLVQASDGYLYGTTYNGGTNGYGTIFRITTNGAFTSLYSFTFGHDGASPEAGLVQASDGYLYGTAYQGGTNDFGTVFRISTNGIFTPLYSFTGGHDGINPVATLVQASDGYLYGTALAGGTNGDGTVFRISTNGVLTPLYSFTGGNDGANPAARLAQASDGNLYGTTQNGGTNGDGTVFRITTNDVFMPLYSFTGGSDGISPNGLIQASDGYLYGTAFVGGANGDGTVFRITTNGVLTPLYSFTGTNDGQAPQGALVQAGDGNLYGTAAAGGANNDGAIFRITTTDVLTPLFSFTKSYNGDEPLAGLIQAGNGNFYGTAYLGGTNNDGTVFALNLSPPALNVSPFGNQSVLFWPGANTNYVLQTTTNLASPNWVTASNAVPITGFTVTNSSPSQFFRLANP